MSPETLWTLMSIAGGGFATARYVVPACRRVVTRVSGALSKVDQIAMELGDNGGKSLKDMVRHMYGVSQVTDARMDLVIDLLEHPLFEAAPDGANVRINEAFTRIFGWAPSDMLGQRWIRILHEDDRHDYVTEWMRAVQDQRAFSQHARYVTRAGVVLEVQVFAQPNFDKTTGAILRWLGRVDTVALQERRPA